ncbi:hypothetical protein VTO42DRAFT_301 [Malbranchea cinnamomea]
MTKDRLRGSSTGISFSDRTQSSTQRANGNRRPIFKPTLILHGGAGNIERSRLPPELYEQYRTSLLTYLRSTADLLNGASDGSREGCSALDAAVHAVSLMEDDELFNCGRGSVFTTAGTIEMEASVMVCSLVRGPERDACSATTTTPTTEMGLYKRGAGVMLVRNVRNPIKLAREVLLRDGRDGSPGGSMHSQLAGPHVERLAKEWGLEFKPDEWFWTKRRWDEHRRGLEGKTVEATIDHDSISGPDAAAQVVGEGDYLSQGTVGCVCLDKWGNLAVATSTGGLTNKFPGRIGDTPTLGAGFWAEAWDEDEPAEQQDSRKRVDHVMRMLTLSPQTSSGTQKDPRRRRAVALSGTGNGDAFLRAAACRTAAAIARLSASSASPSAPVSLADAVHLVAGPGGELQRSPGPGFGGMIGIEAVLDDDSGDCDHQKRTNDAITSDSVASGDSRLTRGKVVFDFNCGGMFRAWIEEDENGVERERVMVFREEYQ